MIKQLFKYVVPALLMLGTCSAQLFADFYVIPVAQSAKMDNVVTVATSGAQFTDVKAAIDSITDAAADNPYLVYIGPGVYNVTAPIQLKAHVTVMGSGREATLLKGSFSGNSEAESAVVLGADDATLTRLGVENTASDSFYVTGIANVNASPRLEALNVTVTSDCYSTGIYNSGSAAPVMRDLHVTAETSGAMKYGIGIVNTDTSSAHITELYAAGSGSSTSMGIANYGLSLPVIRNCTFKGDTRGVSGGARVVLSTIIGTSGTISDTCYGCYDENGNALDDSCAPLP